jgi:nucleotide-binding universal stress UspA family protein
MFEHALFPLNFTETTSRIEEMLAYLSLFGTRKITFLHVVEFGVAAAGRAEKRLWRVSEQAAERGFESRVLVRNGSAANEIVRVSEEEEEEADFIVFSWKPKSWIQRSILGSTTRDVIRLADLPVFVHKHNRPAPDEEGMTVLYATDFKATDADVGPYLSSPGLSGHRLRLMHVGERAPDPAAERARLIDVESNLARLAGEFSGNFDETAETATVGNPRREIVREARRIGADVVIVGKSDAPAGLGAVLGSTAEELPHTARCSVLIIPRQTT